LALFFAAVLLFALAPQPVRAQSEKAFSANFITRFTSVVEGNFLHVTVTGPGQASYLGKSTAFTDSQFVSLIDGSITATYMLTGSSGDTLTLDFVAQGTNVEGGATFAGNYTIVGGTGHFAGQRAVASSSEERSSSPQPMESAHSPSPAPSRGRVKQTAMLMDYTLILSV
jgi:hypothetical protein